MKKDGYFDWKFNFNITDPQFADNYFLIGMHWNPDERADWTDMDTIIERCSLWHIGGAAFQRVLRDHYVDLRAHINLKTKANLTGRSWWQDTNEFHRIELGDLSVQLLRMWTGISDL